MATHISEYDGSISIVGGFKPSGNKPLMEAKDILVGSGNKRLDEVLGSGEGSIQSQISSALDPYSTTSQVKAFNDMANYYTKSQLDGATGKVDKSNIATDVTSSGTDAQVVSAKAAYTAIEAAKTAASNNKTDTVASGSAVPVTSGGVYSELQNYYTKEEAGEMFYVAIVVNTAALSKATFEQGDTSKTTNFNWSTNTLATSAKITVGSGSATETITDGTKKNSGTHSVTIDTDTVGTNSAAKTISVKLDVKDAFNGTATKSVSATICNNIILGGAVRYTGSNLAAVMSDTNMSVKKLQGSKSVSTTNVTVNSGKMLTIAIPTGYGNPSFKIDNQDVTLNKKGSAVKYNNQFGKEVTYDIYQMNPNGNDTDLESSNTTHTVQIS